MPEDDPKVEAAEIEAMAAQVRQAAKDRNMEDEFCIPETGDGGDPPKTKEDYLFLLTALRGLAALRLVPRLKAALVEAHEDAQLQSRNDREEIDRIRNRVAGVEAERRPCATYNGQGGWKEDEVSSENWKDGTFHAVERPDCHGERIDVGGSQGDIDAVIKALEIGRMYTADGEVRALATIAEGRSSITRLGRHLDGAAFRLDEANRRIERFREHALEQSREIKRLRSRLTEIEADDCDGLDGKLPEGVW